MRIDCTGMAGIVTGAASGIGRATAAGLVEAGAQVLLVDRQASVLPEADALRAEGLVLDVAEVGSAEAAVRTAVERFGRLDFVVNAAGVQARGSVVDVTDEVWERLHAVNLRAVFRLCRGIARYLIGQGRPGAIVNIASNASTIGFPGIVAYGAMKGGVTSLTRGLAMELAPHGIRVNAVAPGYTRTGMTADLLSDPAKEALAKARIPLGRIAAPEEIAPAAVFLVSPLAGFITGETLHVDGGQAAG